MAEDDNFDIDIYGDDTTQDYNPNESDVKLEGQSSDTLPDADQAEPSNGASQQEQYSNIGQDDSNQTNGDQTQAISSTGGSSHNHLQPPKKAPTQQGVKRKEGADDSRPIDSNATNALLISELHWWTNEDDIRGWANQSGCEDELVDVTFNEHKVNGKSKGQAFVELSSPQAATALKHKIESFGQGQQYAKKQTAVFHTPHINPYRTLPKDVPNRKEGNQNRGGGSFSGSPGMQNASFSSGGGGGGGFRGGRGGYNNRGGMGMGYNNNNRNFNSPMGGGAMGGGFGGPMGPMGGPMGGMNNMGFNNFGRGGMMGGGGMRGGMGPNRGGRGGMSGGGMNPGMMGGMGPMGGMGGMGMNPGMMGGMGMGMQGGFGGGSQPHFNPAFFGNNNSSSGGGGGGDGNWNPHGAKRPRPE